MSTERFYSYDTEDGLIEHQTAEAARTAAELSLGDCREHCDDGWHEDTCKIEWGKLVPFGECVMCNVVEKADDDTGRCAAMGWDYTCDYKLRELQTQVPKLYVYRNLTEQAAAELLAARDAELATLRAKLATYEQVELPEGCEVKPVNEIRSGRDLAMEFSGFQLIDENGVPLNEVCDSEPWQLYQATANALRKIQEEG